MQEEVKKLKQQIALLQDEHRSLDTKIETGKNMLNMLELQRLKRLKLQLKDQISRLSSTLHPDIIA